jgi:hypothetical protein
MGYAVTSFPVCVKDTTEITIGFLHRSYEGVVSGFERSAAEWKSRNPPYIKEALTQLQSCPSRRTSF